MMKKLWINKINKNFEYGLWVDKIQRSLYRNYKEYSDNKRYKNIFEKGLMLNYANYGKDIDSHIQRMWFFFEKCNDIFENEIGDEDLTKWVKIMFGMTMNVAKAERYIIKRQGGDE